MQQKLADVERKGGSLCVRLKEGSAFDPYIYEQIRMDETCLPPLQERKGVIRYETAGLTSLSYFLAALSFEQEEAYRFIIQLLEQLLKANRTKPVLLDVRYVFLPPQGTFFRFVAFRSMWSLAPAKAGEPDVHRISRVSCADIQGV